MQRWPVIVMIVGGICVSFLWQSGSVHAQSFDHALCQKSLATTASIAGPDSFFAGFDGQSIELVACETTGAAGTLICPSPGTPPGNIGLSLSPEGPFTPEVRVTTTWGNCGSGCLQSPPFYVKGLVDGSTTVDICPTSGQGFPIGCFARGPGIYQVYTVQSMEFDPQNTSLEDWNGGKRIFPGKENPGDTMNHRLVGVKATTNAQPPNPNVFDQRRAKVMFTSVDMDDPTTDNAPIDGNGDLGNDNRGTPKAGRIVGGNNIDIDANGAADTTFEVTMHPGDNFKVIAGCDQTYLSGLSGQGPNVIDADGATITSRQRAHASDMLTVWRKLHVEIDKMGVIGGNVLSGTIVSASLGKRQDSDKILVKLDQSLNDENRFQGGMLFADGAVFDVIGNTQKQNKLVAKIPESPGFFQIVGRPYTLVDDDDFDLNDQSPEFLDGDNGETVLEFPAATALLQNAFEPAFILPVRDGSQENFNIPFILNIPANDEKTQINTWRGLTGSDDFWTSYIQIGYQGDLTEPNGKGDGDPDSENPIGGITPGSCTQGQSDACSFTMNPGGIMNATEVPKGGVGSLVYVEGEKEGVIGIPNIRELTIPHEIGHQFGLHHDGEGFMYTGGGSNSFSQNHLNLLRWRSTSPGQ